MKWLVIQSDGAHKGQDSWTPNWYLRECYSLADALRSQGHQADIWGAGHGNFHVPPDFNSYDGILLVENYDFGWMPEFSEITKPIKVQWIIDLHTQPWSNYLRWSRDMDMVMHSSIRMLEDYERQMPSAKHIWFPNAIDDRYFNLGVEEFPRTTDILFIGGKGSREKTIDRMVAEAGMTYGYGITGASYIDALRRTKIGFNKNLSWDINYRTFETIACGACLLTERDWDLEKLGFVDGKNCVLYESDSGAVERTKDLLGSGQWQGIARGGLELAKRHSYTERIKLLIGHL